MYFYDGAIPVSPHSYEPAIPQTAFLVNSAFRNVKIALQSLNTCNVEQFHLTLTHCTISQCQNTLFFNWITIVVLYLNSLALCIAGKTSTQERKGSAFWYTGPVFFSMLHEDAPNHLRHTNHSGSGWITSEDEKIHRSYRCINNLMWH